MAFNYYHNGDFEKSVKLYAKIKLKIGNHNYFEERCMDTAIDFYIDRCILLLEKKRNGDLKDWDGVYKFSDK